MSDPIADQLAESIRIKRQLIDAQLPTIRAVAQCLIEALRAGNRIYLAGNGGSAADAQHIACELVGRFRRERRALPAVALTTDTSVLTSVANDYGYDAVFARQVDALVESGDVLIGLSTSGTSPNVVGAARLAHERGAVVVAMTGRAGGTLAAIADHALQVDSDQTWRIQEAHITVGHIWCDLVEGALAEPN